MRGTPVILTGFVLRAKWAIMVGDSRRRAGQMGSHFRIFQGGDGIRWERPHEAPRPTPQAVCGDRGRPPGGRR